MIRIRRLTLPTGLSALVRRAPEGDLEIFVSDALEPGDQRAAVRVALRSSRQAGWRAGLLPVPLVLLLAATRSGLRGAARALRVHALASTAAASVAVASAAALIVALPHHQAPSSAGKLPNAGRVYAPEPGRTASMSPRASRSPRARSAQARAAAASAGVASSDTVCGRISRADACHSRAQRVARADAIWHGIIVTSLDAGADTFAASHRRQYLHRDSRRVGLPVSRTGVRQVQARR